jgi:hypothetical protein
LNDVNWEAIGAIGEVGGAIAVVVTLVYLALQIRHSTQATRIAAYHQAQEQLWSVGAAVSTDPELANILARTFSGGIDDLSMPDRLRLEFALGSLYFGFEIMLSLKERGHIESELWENVFENNLRLLGSPLGLEYLATRRGTISRRLEARISERLGKSHDS